MSRVMAESTPPIDQIKNKNVRFGKSGKIAYTHTNRIKHIYTSVQTVGIMGLPIPRIAAPRISLSPQIKYVVEIMTIF